MLIGESPGSRFCAVLLIEQDGKEYKMVDTEFGPRPVLPIFKTTAIPDELVSKMHIKPDQETVDGPSFSVLAHGQG